MRVLMAMLFMTALMASIAMMTSGAESTEPLAVIITSPETRYEVGVEFTVTVHVFSGGEYYDPNQLEVRVDGDEVVVERSGTGKYQVNLMMSDHYYRMVTAVARDADRVSDLATFRIRQASEGDYDLEVIPAFIEPIDGYVTPGQEVTVEVIIRYRSALVDPDSGHPNGTWGHDGDHVLPFDRISKGVYRGTFQVPLDTPLGTRLEIHFSAVYTVGNDTVSGWEVIGIQASFFKVWFHTIHQDRMRSVMELFVTDLDGNPVEGAFVNYSYSYDSYKDEEVKGDLHSVTGEDGRVLFNVHHEMVSYYSLSGMFSVSKDGHSQQYNDQVFGVTYPPFTERHVIGGLYVNRIKERYYLNGRTVTASFQVVKNGQPLEDAFCHVYVSSPDRVIGRQTLTTDKEGRFEINCPIIGAGEYYWLHLCTSVLGEWVTAWSWIYPSGPYYDDLPHLERHKEEGTRLFLEPFRYGETVNITLESTHADGSGESAFIIWSMQPIEEWTGGIWSVGERYYGYFSRGPRFAWTMKDPSEYTERNVDFVACEWSDGAYLANFRIPPFPETVDLTIMGVILFHDEDAPVWRVALLEGIGPASEEWDYHPLIHVDPVVDTLLPGGTLTVTGTSSDDVEVLGNEYRIDDGDWIPVDGTESWTFSVDVDSLSSGDHRVQMRAFDRAYYSPIIELDITVDRQPRVTISTPVDGQSVNGTLLCTGTSTDDGGVQRVLLRLDGGLWMAANGTSEWSLRVPTYFLSFGEHLLEVMCSDGAWLSSPSNVTIRVDQPPSIRLVDHYDGKEHSVSILLKGTATDDGSVARVEVRFGDGEWSSAEGTDRWSYEVDTTSIADGPHDFSARAIDDQGQVVTLTSSLNFERTPEVNEPVGPDGIGWYWIMVVAVVIIIAFLATLFILRRTDKEE